MIAKAGVEFGGLEAKLVMVNPELADHMLKSTHFERQRHLRENNIQRLMGEMKRGWYIAGTPILFAVLPNGDMLMLNGQHSFNALIRANIAIPFTFIYHPVADIEEAGHIYSRLDIHRPRSWSDSYKAAGFEDKVTFDTVWLRTFGTAVNVLLSQLNVTGKNANELAQSRDLRILALEDCLPLVETYISLLAHKHGKHARAWRRGGVMAVAIETLRYQPKRARDFWLRASHDDGLRRTDPSKQLHKYLTTIDARSVDERQLSISAAALCWNAFFAGEEMQQIRPSTRGAVILDGTPWNGKHEPFKALIKRVTPSGTPAFYEGFMTGTRQEKDGSLTRMTEYVGGGAPTLEEKPSE